MYTCRTAFAGHTWNKSSRLLSTQQVLCRTKKMDEPLDPDEPYKYSTSDARDHSSVDTFAPIPKYVPPWYQNPIMGISLFVYLLWFVVLREENDIDEMIYKTSPAFEESLKYRKS